jgi:hypothetical protein
MAADVWVNSEGPGLERENVSKLFAPRTHDLHKLDSRHHRLNPAMNEFEASFVFLNQKINKQ